MECLVLASFNLEVADSTDGAVVATAQLALLGVSELFVVDAAVLTLLLVVVVRLVAAFRGVIGYLRHAAHHINHTEQSQELEFKQLRK